MKKELVPVLDKVAEIFLLICPDFPIALKNKTKTKLIKYQNIGHYKMLWNDNVIENILKFLKKE